MRYTVHIDFHKEYLQVDGNTICIGLTSKPEKGKANRELVSKLAKHFKVPSSNIKIMTGHTSRTKLVDVAPIS